jgi:hypothetical protein
MNRILIASIVFAAGYFVGNSGNRPAPADPPQGVTIGDMMQVCPLLREVAEDPSTLSGCDSAAESWIDRVANDAARQRLFDNN